MKRLKGSAEEGADVPPQALWHTIGVQLDLEVMPTAAGACELGGIMWDGQLQAPLAALTE